MTEIDYSALFDCLDRITPEQMTEESQRLFHGRGHCYQGLEFINVDWLKPSVLVTLYQPLEPSHSQDFLNRLTSHPLMSNSENIIMQHRYHRDNSFEVIKGNNPITCTIQESKLQYQLHFSGKQNTGFFFDMKPGRDWIRQQAKGKKVLNLFAYTCGFSVAAIEGGAEQVINIDMSQSALNIGKTNHKINQQEEALKNQVRFYAHNIFKSWGKIKRLGPFDIIIIDPPSNQKGSFIAEKDYEKIIKRLPELSKKNSQILACLNAPHLNEHFIKELFAQILPNQANFIERLLNRPDFPEKDQSRNLKMMWYEMTDNS